MRIYNESTNYTKRERVPYITTYKGVGYTISFCLIDQLWLKNSSYFLSQGITHMTKGSWTLMYISAPNARVHMNIDEIDSHDSSSSSMISYWQLANKLGSLFLISTLPSQAQHIEVEVGKILSKIVHSKAIIKISIIYLLVKVESDDLYLINSMQHNTLSFIFHFL